MKTEHNVWTEQIMRCSALQKFPLFPEGVKELRDTLQRVAQTPALARKIMDLILDEREYCPTPKEIKEMAEDVKRKEEATPTGCDCCRGNPWVISAAGDSMRRCECPKGQWFRSKDAERRATAK